VRIKFGFNSTTSDSGEDVSYCTLSESDFSANTTCDNADSYFW